MARVLPGEYYVTPHAEAVATVLGSCVSACIRDTRINVGGMNHFMLPLDASQGTSAWGAASSATRYGNVAMERLINEILKLGGRRKIWRSSWWEAGTCRRNEDRNRRAQHRIRAQLHSAGRLPGVRRRPRGLLCTSRDLLSAIRPHARAQIEFRERRGAGSAGARLPKQLDTTPQEGEIELF